MRINRYVGMQVHYDQWHALAYQRSETMPEALTTREKREKTNEMKWDMMRQMTQLGRGVALYRLAYEYHEFWHCEKHWH